MGEEGLSRWYAGVWPCETRSARTYAYCAWAGKRLCGSFAGGSVALKDSADPRQAEWMWACTQGGKTAYSYGDSYDPSRSALTTPCRGNIAPFDQVSNLSGGISEWQDACHGSSGNASCNVQSYLLAHPTDEAASLRCDSTTLLGIGQLDTSIGFRCCRTASHPSHPWESMRRDTMKKPAARSLVAGQPNHDDDDLLVAALDPRDDFGGGSSRLDRRHGALRARRASDISGNSSERKAAQAAPGSAQRMAQKRHFPAAALDKTHRAGSVGRNRHNRAPGACLVGTSTGTAPSRQARCAARTANPRPSRTVRTSRAFDTTLLSSMDVK